MKRLNTMIILILCVTILLVINAVAVFNYRDGVLSCETRKDSMLNFVIKYETLVTSLRSDARQYLETGDENFETSFNEQKNNYRSLNHISLGYRTFTVLQAKEQLDYVNPSEDFTMKAQAEFLDFNDKEQDIYLQFLASYEKLLAILENSMETGDPSVLASLSLEQQYSHQQNLISALSRDYMSRLNEEEDAVVSTQNMTEITLIMLSLLLFAVACVLFVFLLKENKLNSYFRQLYATLVDRVNVGLSITNQAGEYEFMNPKYKQMLGVDNPNPLDKVPSQILDKELSDALNGIPKPAMNERCQGRLQLLVDDEEVYVDYDRFPILDDNSQKKYIDLLHDITDTEIMQQQLKKQLNEIEFYSHAKDSFLANMSHEIKTPINAIVGMTYFLKSTPLSQEQQDLVGKIESSTDVLLAIINDVLDLSKIKSRDLTLYPTAFSLSEVIQSVEDMFIPQITGKGLDWFCETNFVPDLCLRLDRTRLIQVLVNVVNNACKFTTKGYISLSVETKSETTELVHLEFCVEDSGIGIPKQDIPKLFREFEQLENHLTKQHTGTGLGLSICRHIVESMGGRMWVTSEVGTGSRFYFTIPAPKADPVEVETVSEAAPETTSFDGQGAKVLIVEDTEINLEIAQTLLESMNVSCDTATNGLEALECCRKHPDGYYRVILMDIHMPEMDGYTASDILKNEMAVETPIIALTATEVDDETRLKHRDTISGFILKPFKVETFYKTLSKYFPAAASSGETNAVWEAAPDTGSEQPGPFAGKATAIHNLGGMESIYYKHVAKFKANYPETPDHIAELLAAGDMEEARRNAHSVKGLAGTLGMLDLQKAAAILERRIGDNETKLIPAALEDFRRTLNEVISTEP